MTRLIRDPGSPAYRVVVIHEWDADPTTTAADWRSTASWREDPEALAQKYRVAGSERIYYGCYWQPGTAAQVGSYYCNRGVGGAKHRYTYEVQKQNGSWDVKVPAHWVPVHSV